MQRLHTSDPAVMLPGARERNKVEAKKPVLYFGHLLGRVEPVAQPATARRVRRWPVVRRVLLILLRPWDIHDGTGVGPIPCEAPRTSLPRAHVSSQKETRRPVPPRETGRPWEMGDRKS